MTRRRRGKRGRTSPDPPAKRRRGGPPGLEVDEPEPAPAPALAPAGAAAPQPSMVMVAGLPPGCGVMELKSRLEAYGPIARSRVDAAAATGYVTFRSGEAAVAAIAASLDPDGGITIGCKKVLIVQASEALNNSKSVVRAADPAGQSLHDATANNVIDDSAVPSSKAASRATYKAREIVAYDDLF
ncbi:uncharacterized protein At1g27050 [Phragmites australis]|uniref:uncharacterized protein At1g27050 n=1 Tax=Phragmites australis TaxID=29695 RepID=UPI002D775E3A|nr:uncharacterized protein At1g27050 [Phragmites australis]